MNSAQQTQLEGYISTKDTTFGITKVTSPTGVFEKHDYDLEKYKELFNFFQTTFTEIKIPKNTLIFHSNQFFSKELNNFEPIGKCMKIQDIRKYGNKGVSTTSKYPFSQMMERVYANFSPGGNIKVAGNRSVAESVYVSTEDLYFCQLPYIDGYGHMKSVFNIENSRIFKEYIEYKNSENKDTEKKYCGFILSTTTDETDILDTDATYIKDGSRYVYPEILILDGFDKFIKKAQYDIYDLKESEKTFDYIHTLVDTTSVPETSIPKKTLDVQKAEISSLGATKQNIGKYGLLDLYAYIVPEESKTSASAADSLLRLNFPHDFFSMPITLAGPIALIAPRIPASIFTDIKPLGGAAIAPIRIGGGAKMAAVQIGKKPVAETMSGYTSALCTPENYPVITYTFVSTKGYRLIATPYQFQRIESNMNQFKIVCEDVISPTGTKVVLPYRFQVGDDINGFEAIGTHDARRNIYVYTLTPLSLAKIFQVTSVYDYTTICKKNHNLLSYFNINYHNYIPYKLYSINIVDRTVPLGAISSYPTVPPTPYKSLGAAGGAGGSSSVYQAVPPTPYKSLGAAGGAGGSSSVYPAVLQAPSDVDISSVRTSMQGDEVILHLHTPSKPVYMFRALVYDPPMLPQFTLISKLDTVAPYRFKIKTDGCDFYLEGGYDNQYSLKSATKLEVEGISRISSPFTGIVSPLHKDTFNRYKDKYASHININAGDKFVKYSCAFDYSLYGGGAAGGKPVTFAAPTSYGGGAAGGKPVTFAAPTSYGGNHVTSAKHVEPSDDKKGSCTIS